MNDAPEKNLTNYTDSYNYIYNNILLPANFSENTKKRIDKDKKLRIIKRKNLQKKLSLEKIWDSIQNNIFKNFIDYFQKLNNQKL